MWVRGLIQDPYQYLILDVGLRATGRATCVHNTCWDTRPLGIWLLKSRSGEKVRARPGPWFQNPKDFPPTLTVAHCSRPGSDPFPFQDAP